MDGHPDEQLNLDRIAWNENRKPGDRRPNHDLQKTTNHLEKRKQIEKNKPNVDRIFTHY